LCVQSAISPSGKTGPAVWRGPVSPTRDLWVRRCLHGSMLPACTLEGHRPGGVIPRGYPPEPSGLSTALKIESRGCFQGEKPRPLGPSPGSPALFHTKQSIAPDNRKRSSLPSKKRCCSPVPMTDQGNPFLEPKRNSQGNAKGRDDARPVSEKTVIAFWAAYAVPPLPLGDG
jgi:hypothetical protein